MHIAHLHIAHQSNQHISTLADLGKVCKILQFFSKIEFFLGLDTAENEPCKDLQKVCKILQDFRKVCKILQDLQNVLQNFWQLFFGIFKNCLELFGIFKKQFGIFRNFQKNVWSSSEFSKQSLNMSWNFLLPNNHSYRTTARSAPVDTASRQQLQLFQAPSNDKKCPGRNFKC